MNIPTELLYSAEHEWVRIEDSVAYVGITDYAQKELGDIVFLDIESIGETLSAGEIFGSIEAVKTVSDLFMPVSGEVVEINPEIEKSPDLVNTDPYGKGWVIKVKLTDSSIDSLLNAEKYTELVK